ncbi:hypothetical protein L596_028898 [Steinernema carpocapsae]|uniref:Amine oxidase domain-containing protein n=1 Tax=Steinernema carpocapsae TaxID=34508 RepID=A0A4U5M0S3_STECR|nr:hypothetical protein L596_028898 [Steinernema carpocapsae]
MFSPQLSNHKLAAVEALGYGNLIKVFLIYEKPWWHYKESSIGALRVKSCSMSSPLMNYFHTFKTLEGVEVVPSRLDLGLGSPDDQRSHRRPPQKTHNPASPGRHGRQQHSYALRDASVWLANGGCEEVAEPVVSKVFFAGEATSLKM